MSNNKNPQASLKATEQTSRNNESYPERTIIKRRLPTFGVLILAFGAAWMTWTTGACNGLILPPPDVTLPDTPTETSEECADTLEVPCKRYRIELLGNPTGNVELQKSYKEKFGSACYVAAKDDSFNCYFKTPQDACEAVLLVPIAFDAAAYEDHPETCQQVNGTDIWSLQTGSDPANVTYIYFEDAPRQTPLVEINGVPTEVNGPYRNLVEATSVEPGKDFYDNSGMVDADGGFLTQKDWILQVNRNKHGDNKIHSDLAGFMFPCEKGKPKLCPEPDILGEPSWLLDARAEVHHVMPMKDKRCCPLGTNAYRNAAVISHKLNVYLTNNDPPEEEVKRLNDAAAYTP